MRGAFLLLTGARQGVKMGQTKAETRSGTAFCALAGRKQGNDQKRMQISVEKVFAS
jgi:hypothetical protein